MKQQQQKKGFTLIELLVVIAIIGILSAIGLVALNGAREKARDAKRQADLSSLRSALALYFDDHSDAYPASTTAECVYGGAAITGCTADWVTLKTALVSTYSAALPLPPSTGSADPMREYNYWSSTTANKHYVLYTQLEGGSKNFYYINDVGKTDSTGTAAPSTCTDSACP
ncbi:MAG: prepilin-type N-terminal cleavage/methylation domain-containing protein [Candidatus Kerfeldbacteria bacterium]|nr:prepilin-type N-terminal cleavage/methylation domain-containing protein [Candidatus Kerfeldbacteria bacterium]